MRRGPFETGHSSVEGSIFIAESRPMTEITHATSRLQHSHFLVRRKLLKMIGAAFYVDAPDGSLLLYANQKAFKLKEDIRLYTGEDMKQEVLTIKARQIFDFGATYDVVDSQSGQLVGALRRKALKSIMRDEWLFLDAHDREMGTILEDSALLATIRRIIDFATYFLPQSYHASLDNRPVAVYKQTRNPVLIKIMVDFTPDMAHVLDRRLGIAAAVLLCAIEGKQHSLT